MPGLTLDLILRALPIGMSAGAMLFAWMAGRRKDVDERIGGHDRRLVELERSKERMEQRIEATPSKDDVHGLELTLTRLAAGMETVSVTLAGQREITDRVERTLGRVEDHLLKDK